MGQTVPARTRRTGILALLAALACLAGCGMAGLNKSPSGAPTSPPGMVTPGAGMAAPRQDRLAAVSWPADGVSAADISGFGVVAGPGRNPAGAYRQRRQGDDRVRGPARPSAAFGRIRAGYRGPAVGGRRISVARLATATRWYLSARGARLTERQALEALLLPSADNMAWILARWDAGSQAAFVAQMNATARRLGMTGTSYTDPSGLDPSTTSTAADQVRLGMAAMRMPVLAAIAAKSAAVVPVACVVRNYNTLLGQDGIAGSQDRQHAGRRRTRSHRGLAQGGRAQHPDRGRHVRPARHGRDHPAKRIASRPQPRACPGSRPRLWRAVRFA